MTAGYPQIFLCVRKCVRVCAYTYIYIFVFAFTYIFLCVYAHTSGCSFVTHISTPFLVYFHVFLRNFFLGFLFFGLQVWPLFHHSCIDTIFGVFKCIRLVLFCLLYCYFFWLYVWMFFRQSSIETIFGKNLMYLFGSVCSFFFGLYVWMFFRQYRNHFLGLLCICLILFFFSWLFVWMFFRHTFIATICSQKGIGVCVCAC